MPIASNSPCTVPSSPSLPCSATNAASGWASSSCATRSGPTSIATTSWPSWRSALCARAPERSETVRSSEPPPLRTATFLAPALIDPGAAATASSCCGAARQLDHVGQLRSRSVSAAEPVPARPAAERVSVPPPSLARLGVVRAEEPVNVPISPVSGRAIALIRRMPSRMSSSGTPAKFSRIELAPLRPSTSMYAERPGTKATPLLRPIRSVVSTPSSVAQMNSPPSGRVQRGAPAEVLGERLEHHVAPAPVEIAQALDVLDPGRAAVGGALGEVGGDEQLGHRRAAQVGALFAEVQLLQHRPRRDRPAEAQARARGSSRTCPGRSRGPTDVAVPADVQRPASTASAAARPRSAAGRRGCPRAPAARARARPRPVAAGAAATSSPRRGSGSWGSCR